MFRVLTPVSCWVLLGMWVVILFLFVRQLRSGRVGNRLVVLLLIVLSINALAALLDSAYLGVWYTAKAGWLPASVSALLEKAEYAFVPRALNMVAAVLMIGILLRRWPSQDEQARQAHLSRIQEMESRIAERELAQREREELIAELEHLSLKDALTGVHNRRGFWLLAERHARLAHRRGEPFCLVYGDLDGLKWVNDNYGHTTGDTVLKASARVLEESFRDSDIVARMGGDEFVVLLAGTPESEVAASIRRFEANMEQCHELAELPFKASISLGIASYDGTEEPDIEALIGKADRRMYEQKRLRPGRTNGMGEAAEIGLPMRS